jgi:hypothetical protein
MAFKSPTLSLLPCKVFWMVVSVILVLALIHPVAAFSAGVRTGKTADSRPADEAMEMENANGEFLYLNSLKSNHALTLSGKDSLAAGAYSLSGTVTYNGVGRPGIPIVLSMSGTILETATTDANGNYAFPNLQNETYTITPSKTGYTFSPENRMVTVNSSGQNDMDFSVQLYSISGTVANNGKGLSGITMNLSGAATASVTTDSYGNYAFLNLLNGNYAVTPSNRNYPFASDTKWVTVTGISPAGINFAPTAPRLPSSNSGSATGLSSVAAALSGTALVEAGPAYSISGTVTYNGNGLGNVAMRLSGAASAETTTDKYGSYAFIDLPNGSYKISPRKSPYAFSELAVTINGANQVRKNIDATYGGCSCESLSENSVTFSAQSRTFKDAFSVTLSTSISGAVIRYTTDGQNPASSSNLYAGAINIASTTRLIAAAFVGGTMQGFPSSAVYIKMDSAFQSTTHNLPVILLDSYGSGTLPTSDPRPYVDAAYLAFDPADYGGSFTLSPTAPTPSAASISALHIHGNSSSMFDKKSYRLEMRHETVEDRDCPMFGMPEDSDWVLIGPYADKTLIHNNFVYELGRDLDMAASRIKLVEVYVNLNGGALANSHYQGVYQLVETIKNSKNRLDLKQLHAGDLASPTITGGYIFRLEWLNPSPPEIQCPAGALNCWNYLYVVDPDDWPDKDMAATSNPKPAYLTHPQYLYLQNRLKSFNDAINGANYADPTTGYPAYIDEQSFIDTLILNELTRSFDGMVRSQYFHKQRDKAGETAKIFAGPLWDFDLIAGVGFVFNNIDSTLPNDNFQYNANASRISQTATWFPKFFSLIADRNSNFSKHFRTRWNTLRQPGGFLSNSSMNARIDALAEGLGNAAIRNFAKWNILNTSPIPSGPAFKSPKTSTWPEQIPLMKSWLNSRAAWLDTQWPPVN